MLTGNGSPLYGYRCEGLCSPHLLPGCHGDCPCWRTAERDSAVSILWHEINAERSVVHYVTVGLLGRILDYKQGIGCLAVNYLGTWTKQVFLCGPRFFFFFFFLWRKRGLWCNRHDSNTPWCPFTLPSDDPKDSQVHNPLSVIEKFPSFRIQFQNLLGRTPELI